MIAPRTSTLHVLAIRAALFGALAASVSIAGQRLFATLADPSLGAVRFAQDLGWVMAAILLLATSSVLFRANASSPGRLPSLATVLGLFAILSLALFAIGTGAYVVQADEARQQARRLLASQVDERVDQMRAWMDLRRQETQGRQSDPLLLEIVQRWRRTGRAEDHQRLHAWLHDLHQAQGLDNLSLLDLDQRPLIEAHDHEPPPGLAAAADQAAATGAPVLIPVHHHGDDPSIAWIAPIQVRTPQGARTVAMLLSEVNARAMLRRAVDTDRAAPWPPEVLVLAIGEQGPLRSVVSAGAAVASEDLGTLEAIARRADLETGSHAETSRGGERLLLHMRRVPLLDWVLVAAYPESQVLQTLRRRFAILGVVLLATLAAGLVVAVELWRNLRREQIHDAREHERMLRESERLRQASERRLEHLTQSDPLVALPGKAALRQELAAGLARSSRTRRDGALLVIGLDRLSTMHDTLGDAFGDEVLVASSHRIGAVLRSGDYLGRLGPGEFAVVLENLTDLDEAARLCRILIDTLSEPFPLADGRRARLTASVGVAPFVHTDVPGTDLVLQACSSLHQAQVEGGAKYCFHRPEQTLAARRRLDLEMRLYQAQADDELDLHYQPLVDLSTGQVRGVEALLRWHPRGGAAVSPAEFVPVAEQSGLIEPIGDWVLRRACRDMARWRRAGHDLRVLSVNLSPRQLVLPDIERRIAAALEASGLEPSVLELEITESALVGNFEDIVQTLRRLKSIGIRLAVDDFGTGYSSMSYLKRFPLDKIKIDRSFVGDLPHDDVDAQIVTAIAALGRALELEVLAEGVESAPQAAFLMGIGCRTAQGFLFSRGLPDGEFLAWLARQPRAAGPAAGGS